MMLDLNSIGEQQLSIATFGSTRTDSKVCPIVRVGVSLNGYPDVNVSLFVTSVICEPLFSQPISTCIGKYPHLANLHLADWAEEGSRLGIDILVGSDYYWDFITGAISKAASGPTAIHTKLGWVLSGP